MTRKTSKSLVPSQKPLKQFGKSTACDRNSDQIKDGCPAYAIPTQFQQNQNAEVLATCAQLTSRSLAAQRLVEFSNAFFRDIRQRRRGSLASKKLSEGCPVNNQNPLKIHDFNVQQVFWEWRRNR
jgi:hypothetical protein